MNLNEAARGGRARCFGAWRLGVFFALALFWGLAAYATPPPAGIAPVISPAGGFSIDGNLLANTPDANTGDWLLSTNSGSGGAVLDATGAPLNPTTTFHFIDAYNSGSDNTFAGGLKWTDNPN